MELTASAPGKLVLLGEYAVLEGAPALVLAVNRRANVRIAARTDGICEVNAPELDVAGARMSIDADGGLHWQCADRDADKLSLVDHIWQGLLHEGLAPRSGDGFNLHLDTSCFFHANGTGRVKLGLGSSAALTVALASALATFAGQGEATAERTRWLRRLFRMHGTWQGGRGSGVDVAAGVAGGLIAYRLTGQDPQPSFVPLGWPMAGVHCLFIWSGQAVSTANYLLHLAEWRQSHRAEYALHMQELGALAEAAAEALQQERAAAFVELAAVYATALRNFGVACGLEIFSPAQQRFADIAADAGVSYKPCGAGGDFGVVFSEDADRLVSIRQHIIDADMHDMPLKSDTQGFTCAIHLTSDCS